MSNTAKVLNPIIVERLGRDPNGVAGMVHDYMQAQLGDPSGPFGIAVEDVLLLKEGDVIKLCFTLHLDKKEVRHRAQWSVLSLLTCTSSITSLIRDELNQALSNLHGA